MSHKVWGIAEEDLPKPGRSAYEMLDAMGTEGGVRALLVFGSNLAVSAPRAGHIEKRLDALDFLMVSDFFLSETAERADVVLPAAQWAEEEGTMTNLEGRVLLRQRATAAAPGVRTDLEILGALGARLGYERFFPADPRKSSRNCGARLRGGAADYAGITYERIASEDGVFWPCPSEDHPGTPRLFLDRFATADGRARFHPDGIPRPRRRAGSRVPAVSHHGPHHGAVSVGNADPARPGADAGFAQGLRADSSVHGAHLWNRPRRAGSPDDAPRHGAAGRGTDAARSAWTRCSCLFISAGRDEPTCSPIPRSILFPACRNSKSAPSVLRKEARVRETRIHSRSFFV